MKLSTRTLRLLAIWTLSLSVPSCASNSSRPEETCINGGIEEILGTIPDSWAELRSADLAAQSLYWVNFSQLRADKMIPPITGEDSRQTKLDLVLELDLQALAWTPPEIDPSSGSAFESWGWDVADLEQALKLPGLEITILIGDFTRPEIISKLEEKGYEGAPSYGYRMFHSDSSDLEFAHKEDRLIVGKIDGEEDELMSLLAFMASGEPGLNTHTSVAPLLTHMGCAWGAVLSPPIDDDIFSVNQLQSPFATIPPATQAAMLEEHGLDKAFHIFWDFLLIAFRGG